MLEGRLPPVVHEHGVERGGVERGGDAAADGDGPRRGVVRERQVRRERERDQDGGVVQDAGHAVPLPVVAAVREEERVVRVLGVERLHVLRRERPCLGAVAGPARPPVAAERLPLEEALAVVPLVGLRRVPDEILARRSPAPCRSPRASSAAIPSVKRVMFIVPSSSHGAGGPRLSAMVRTYQSGVALHPASHLRYTRRDARKARRRPRHARHQARPGPARRPLGAWRPSVAVCQHEDLVVRRLELLHQPRDADARRRSCSKDIRRASPETEARGVPLALEDPWDFEEVYAALHDFARGYPFAPEHEDYLVHITTGTHVAQICIFLLTESRALPRPPPPDLSAQGAARRAGDLRHHRPRPLALRPARLPLPRGSSARP